MLNERIITRVDGTDIVTAEPISAEMAKIVANPQLYEMALNGEVPEIEGMDSEEMRKSVKSIEAMD